MYKHKTFSMFIIQIRMVSQDDNDGDDDDDFKRQGN